MLFLTPFSGHLGYSHFNGISQSDKDNTIVCVQGVQP